MTPIEKQPGANYFENYKNPEQRLRVLIFKRFVAQTLGLEIMS
jgi:hypothetical protein